MKPPHSASVYLKLKHSFHLAAFRWGLALPWIPVLSAPASGQAAGGSVELPLLETVAAAREPGAPPPIPIRPPPGPNERAAYDIGRTATAVDLDGYLNETAWNDAIPISLPYETFPGDNAPARVRTECYLTFDDHQLYLGCVAHDPEPEGIRAYITDRDGTSGHDRIVVAFDPFNDARRAFEFGISALGVQSDAVYEEQGGGADQSWDAIWSSAARITKAGYVVEAAIPFKSLRFPETDGVQTWGFHARREWPRNELVQTRSIYWDRAQACLLCQANLVRGIQGVSPGLNVELVPTLTATKVDARPDGSSSRFDGGSIQPEVGLDVRWGITSDLALNAAINPDFSQIEADAPQLDVNNRFALFFPERRPFFLEGADFFQTPIQAVFTRTVADPVLGNKLTGKVGGAAMGALVALDEVNNLLFPGNQGSSATSLDQRVWTSMARYRRDVGTSNTVGGLYTGRVGDRYGNHVVGVDAFLRPLPALSLSAQVLHSETAYPRDVATTFEQPSNRFGGNAAALRLTYETRDWFANLSTRAFDPEFRADAGFVTRVDLKAINAWVNRYFWSAPDAFLTRTELSGGAWHTENWEGRLGEEGVWMNVGAQGPWQSDVWVNPNLARQWFAGEVHEFLQLWSGFALQPNGTVGVEFFGMVGGAVDFANAREAHQVIASPSVEFRLGRRVDLRGSLRWQRQSLAGETIFRALVSEVRAVYNVNPRTFVRALVQLRDTHRNPDMHRDLVSPERTSVATQLLFSYKVNPLTVLFLGYSDDRLGLTQTDLTRVPLTEMQRAFFLKLGYAWRP